MIDDDPAFVQFGDFLIVGELANAFTCCALIQLLACV